MASLRRKIWGMNMLQYLINMTADGADCWLTFSDEDVSRIRSATQGKTIDLENYVAFRPEEQSLALSKKPAHVDSAVVSYAQLCKKLAEAEIAADEVRRER
jgi:hypothetical protein